MEGVCTETAFAHTVPLLAAVTKPVVLIDALPVTTTMLHVTAWLALAGNKVATICNVPPAELIAAGTLPCVDTIMEVTVTPAWPVIVISKESETVLSRTDTAFAQTVPLVCAVTKPLVLMVAIPVPVTILQVTAWLAVAGNIFAVICKVPAGVVIVEDTLPCVPTTKANNPPGVIFCA